MSFKDAYDKEWNDIITTHGKEGAHNIHQAAWGATPNFDRDSQWQYEILRAARLGYELRMKGKPEAYPVLDLFGNNAAVECPGCNHVYIVSGMIHKKGRDCPVCHESLAIFTDKKFVEVRES